VRDFAKGTGQLAQTNRIDADIVARFRSAIARAKTIAPVLCAIAWIGWPATAVSKQINASTASVNCVEISRRRERIKELT